MAAGFAAGRGVEVCGRAPLRGPPPGKGVEGGLDSGDDLRPDASTGRLSIGGGRRGRPRCPRPPAAAAALSTGATRASRGRPDLGSRPPWRETEHHAEGTPGGAPDRQSPHRPTTRRRRSDQAPRAATGGARKRSEQGARRDHGRRRPQGGRLGGASREASRGAVGGCCVRTAPVPGRRVRGIWRRRPPEAATTTERAQVTGLRRSRGTYRPAPSGAPCRRRNGRFVSAPETSTGPGSSPVTGSIPLKTGGGKGLYYLPSRM